MHTKQNEKQQIVLIGGGKMGTDLFNHLSQFPLHVTLIQRHNADRAQSKYERKIQRAHKNGLLSNSEAEFKKQYHRITDSSEAIVEADIIIDCIDENLNAKQKLFEEISELASPTCLIATCSSSFAPEKICTDSTDLKRFVGMHFFYPMALRPIAELIYNKMTSEVFVQKAEQFLNEIQIAFLKQQAPDVFLLNRLLLHWQAGLFNCAQTMQIKPEIIDDLIRSRLQTNGSFEIIDSVGQSTLLQAAENYMEYEPNKAYYAPLIAQIKSNISQRKSFINSTSAPAKLNSGQIERVLNCSKNALSQFQKHYAAQLNCPRKPNNFFVEMLFS